MKKKYCTFSQARATLTSLLDEITDEQRIVIVRWRGKEEVAMLPASELSSLMETVYLLRSSKNGLRLLTALERTAKAATSK